MDGLENEGPRCLVGQWTVESHVSKLFRLVKHSLFYVLVLVWWSCFHRCVVLWIFHFLKGFNERIFVFGTGASSLCFIHCLRLEPLGGLPMWGGWTLSLLCLKHQSTQGAWNSENQPFMSDVSMGWHTSQSLKLGECLRIFEKVDGNFQCYRVYLHCRGLVVYPENKTRKTDFQKMVGRCIITPRCLSYVLLIIHSYTYLSHLIPIRKLCLWNVPPQRWSCDCHQQYSLHPWKRQPAT